MESFEFKNSVSITMRLLSSLRPVTVKLQKCSSDILKVYAQLSDVQLDLELLKLNCEEEFHIWFEEVAKFAEILAVDVSVPRVVTRHAHAHAQGISGDSPEEY